MMLLIGQPVWQNGIPQSMQRAPCFDAASSASVMMNSRKLFTRSEVGSATSWIRESSMKPVTLPMLLPNGDYVIPSAARNPLFGEQQIPRRCAARDDRLYCVMP